MKSLPWRNILGYSLGDVANNFAFAMGALYLLSYYVDQAGIGAASAGAILLGVRVFDAFADVFAGRIVDSVKTRFGKFRPFLISASFPLMFMSVMVFFVPTDWSHDMRVLYATISYALLGLFYSLVNNPYGSLATAMTQDPRSRARLGAARSIAASCTFVMLAFVIGPSIATSDAESATAAYRMGTTVLAIIGICLYFICFLSTRENVERTVAQPSFSVSVQTVKKNHPLFMLCGTALFMLAANFTVSASGIFYVRYMLKDPSLFTVLVIVQNLIGCVLASLCIPSLVGKLGKKNTFLTGASIAFCGFVVFFFLSPYFYPAMIAFAVAAIGLGICMTTMWALEADTVEYGEYQTGVRIEGLTYSLFSLTRKCGQALGGSIPAFILSLCGYIANQDQTPEVIMGLRCTIAVVPAVCISVSFVIMFFYPLTDKYFAEIVTEMARRRAADKAAVMGEIKVESETPAAKEQA